MRYIYQDISDREVRLLRIYGSMSEVEVPSTIAGKKVTEIGSYCFSASEHLPAKQQDISQQARLTCGDEYKIFGEELSDAMCSLSGNYVESISLPDTIIKVGDAAFYNCRKLRMLSIKSMPQLGSDVFVNCFSLCTLIVRSGVREASAAQAVLKLISSEVEVIFKKNDTIEAKILFPEYFETYDEISPAHIFGRNIEGEGFRARTCFKDDVIELARYDDIFYKARNEESLEVLWHLIYDRLHDPVDLKSSPQELYEEYLEKNIEHILAYIMRKKDMEQLEFLCSYKKGHWMTDPDDVSRHILTTIHLDHAIQYAAELDWSEAGAYLMEQKHARTQTKKTDRYAF